MAGKKLITKLNLIAHPEGGYYRQTYRSEETTINRNGAIRSVCTSIFYLLQGNDKSCFHRIQSDELWFFHKGNPIEIYYIFKGELVKVTLGKNLEKGHVLSFMIPANTWFAAKLKHSRGFALVSCTVSPGFEFDDFELAERDRLIEEYPGLKQIIKEFTRE